MSEGRNPPIASGAIWAEAQNNGAGEDWLEPLREGGEAAVLWRQAGFQKGLQLQ